MTPTALRGLAPLFMLCLLAAPAFAAEPPVSVELNKLEGAGKDCRATLVVQNRETSAYSELKLDLVVFDAGGIVAKRVIVDVAPLPAKKTSVKSFDITGLACDTVSRLLLNEVTACGGAEGGCLGVVAPSSRAATPFNE